jgi:hypothetical protein
MARSTRTRSKAAPKRRRASSTRKQPRRGASTPWPTIEEFLDSGEGDITLGAINHSSLRYTAVVSDHHNMLVALVRDRGETLHQLLDRLECALGPALEDQVYVDEVNGPQSDSRIGELDVEQIAQQLLARSEQPDGIVITPGVYALFLNDPRAFSTLGVDKNGLLYIGMTADNTGARDHFDPPTGHSGFSSPRRSIGALLKHELQLRACPGADNFGDFRFADGGELALTEWMKSHLRMNLVPIPRDRAKIEQVERRLIANLKPPLNLKGWSNPQARTLNVLRKICRDEARDLPDHAVVSTVRLTHPVSARRPPRRR